MKAKISFTKLLQLWGIIFLIAVGSSIIAIDIFISSHHFKIQAEQMRTKYIAAQKKMIKQEVDRVVAMINHEKSRSEALIREKIKTRVYEAYAIAQHIYEQNKSVKNKNEIKQMILEALRPIRFERGIGYYFVTRLDGVEMLFADKPEMEGLNLLNLQDSHGKYVIKDLIKIAVKSGEGFYEYHWTKPAAEGNNFKKITFIKQFKPLACFIGTGLYMDDIEVLVKKQLMEQINRIRFGKNGYLFVNNWQGISLAHGAQPNLIGTNMWDTEDSKGNKATQLLVAASKKGDGGYVFYWWKKPATGKESPKIAYAKGVPDWKLFVGTGVYLDDAETEIALMQSALNRQIKTKIRYFSLLIAGMVAILLFLSNFLTRKFKNDFNLFISFFNKAVHSDQPINRDMVKFIEFDQMAENANKMLRDKIKARQELLNERERLFVTIRSIGDAVITTDISGRVTLMNMMAEQLTGWKNAEAEGKPLTEVFTIVNAGTGEEAKNPVELVLEHGKTVGLANHTKLISKNGEEYQISDSAAPIKDVNGKITGVVLVFRDMTKEFRMREKLLTSEQRLRTLINSTPDIICFKDAKGRWLEANDADLKLFSLTDVDYRGKTDSELADFTDPIYRNAFLTCEASDETAWQANGISRKEEVIPQPDGSQKIYDVIKVPIFNTDGSRKGLVVLGRDITERKLAEEELQKMAKLKSVGTLAGGIAHDFNNILMGLFGNISMARLELSEDHPAFKFLGKAEKSMDRATFLTNQLLTFAKGGEPVRKNVPLDTLVRDIVRFDLSGSNVKPIFKLANSLWLADVDKGQIQQVFSNLTINADQAMPDGGHLYITMENEDLSRESLHGLKPGKYLKVTVKDEGTGIDPKQLGRIFDPYFTTKQAGSGLGLATTYSIINKHGGHIGVESTLGKGTVFTLYLPASEARQLPEAREPVTKLSPAQRPKVLVMDDEEMIRDIAAQMLKKNGYEVQTAEHGEQAIEMYSQALNSSEPFDAVIMDLTIPGGMGGEETMKKILALDPEARGIVSSGYANDRIMANYSEYGFRDIVSKPYKIDQLREVLNRVLGK